MGVLDEAIREHLELKRRHGAAEEELRRQEADALGPARRSTPEPDPMGGPANGGSADVPGDVSDAAEPDESGELATSTRDAPWDRDLDWVDSRRQREREPPDREVAEGEPPPAAADETFVLARDESPDAPDESLEADEPLDAPEEPPPALDEPPKRAGIDDALPPPSEATLRPNSEAGATVSMPAPDFNEPGDEADLRSEPADEDPDEREDADPERDPDDVLEETPDFLQETPEHDRLWFEQKPPRDFDFDE